MSERGRHKCPGCTLRVPDNYFACLDCWSRLPLDIRQRINAAALRRHADRRSHWQAMAEGIGWYRKNPVGVPR